MTKTFKLVFFVETKIDSFSDTSILLHKSWRRNEFPTTDLDKRRKESRGKFLRFSDLGFRLEEKHFFLKKLFPFRT